MRLRFPALVEAAYQAYLDERFRGWVRLAWVASVLMLIGRTPLIAVFSIQDVPPEIEVGTYALPSFVVLSGFNVVALVIALVGAGRTFAGASVREAQRTAIAGGVVLILAFLSTHNLRTVPSYLSPMGIPLIVLGLVLGFRLGFGCTAALVALTLALQMGFERFNTFPALVKANALFIVVPYLVLALVIAYLLERDTRNEFLVRRALQLEREALAARTELLAQDAMTDELTQVANRRKFEETLAQEWRRARRSGSPISLIMLDIDHFKRLNDRFGHRHGDDVLLIISDRLRAFAKRPGDLVARYGGEEFALILSDTPRVPAEEIAERLRRAIEGLGLASGVEPAGFVTISAGVATMRPALGGEPSQLVQAADGALYRAKQNGRNRVDVAADPADVEGLRPGSPA
ncbi:MAG: hypothetical protein KatS3mg060_1457 [Dehalococcoidia bacterium]|nr:MAG: hypothetical protein KatS3mg060_1457 [Dehalococcoidia bacterium]